MNCISNKVTSFSAVSNREAGKGHEDAGQMHPQRLKGIVE